MNDLPALLGGTPVRSTPFPIYRTIGAEEKQAVMEVLDSGVLSQFLGAWSPDFLGGPRVRELEADWSRHFAVAHTISVNSATSGLYAAVGAAGVGPGDEVIVSPYTMSASAALPPLPKNRILPPPRTVPLDVVEVRTIGNRHAPLATCGRPSCAQSAVTL